MGDEHGSSWMSILPWTLLARRTAFHSELQASPSELVLGENPLIPGDLTHNGPDDHSVPELLDRLRKNASREPAQTTIRRTIKPYFPPSATNATHVWVKRGKTTPLSPIKDGPFRILERLGKSCLKIKTRTMANGQIQTEVVHWKNCAPMVLPLETEEYNRPRPGRPST